MFYSSRLMRRKHHVFGMQSVYFRRICDRICDRICNRDDYYDYYFTEGLKGQFIADFAVSDWSVVRIYPHFLRPIGPSREYTRTSCVRLVRRANMPTRSKILSSPAALHYPPGSKTTKLLL
eukprot:1713657-Pyramimonas_sp.AAC.2